MSAAAVDTKAPSPYADYTYTSSPFASDWCTKAAGSAIKGIKVFDRRLPCISDQTQLDADELQRRAYFVGRKDFCYCWPLGAVIKVAVMNPDYDTFKPTLQMLSHAMAHVLDFRDLGSSISIQFQAVEEWTSADVRICIVSDTARVITRTGYLGHSTQRHLSDIEHGESNAVALADADKPTMAIGSKATYGSIYHAVCHILGFGHLNTGEFRDVYVPNPHGIMNAPHLMTWGQRLPLSDRWWLWHTYPERPTELGKFPKSPIDMKLTRDETTNGFVRTYAFKLAVAVKSADAPTPMVFKPLQKINEDVKVDRFEVLLLELKKQMTVMDLKLASISSVVKSTEAISSASHNLIVTSLSQ